jgi:hypothetical protein
MTDKLTFSGHDADTNVSKNVELEIIGRAAAVSDQSVKPGADSDADVQVVENRFTGAYISTATTTTLKTSAGVLRSITVNGGTAGAITIYDNTAASGDIIAAFDSTNALATYTFDREFATGLTIVTAAATKVSVSYR